MAVAAQARKAELKWRSKMEQKLRFLGRRPQFSFLGSLGIVCHLIHLAVPSLSGHRLDVSRGLCPCGHADAAFQRLYRGRSLSSDPHLFSCLNSHQSHSFFPRDDRGVLFLICYILGSRVFLFCLSGLSTPNRGTSEAFVACVRGVPSRVVCGDGDE